MRKKKNVAGAVKAFFRDLLLWLVRPKEFADAINEAEDEKDLDDRLRALYAGKTLHQLKHDAARRCRRSGLRGMPSAHLLSERSVQLGRGRAGERSGRQWINTKQSSPLI